MDLQSGLNLVRLPQNSVSEGRRVTSSGGGEAAPVATGASIKSDESVARLPSGLKAVNQRQYQTTMENCTDGSRELKRTDKKCTELFGPGNGDNPVQSRSMRTDQRLKRLSDGRKVVIETLTFERVKYMQ